MMNMQQMPIISTIQALDQFGNVIASSQPGPHQNALLQQELMQERMIQ
jgi:S-adenosylmethionine hydrolase